MPMTHQHSMDVSQSWSARSAPRQAGDALEAGRARALARQVGSRAVTCQVAWSEGPAAMGDRAAGSRAPAYNTRLSIPAGSAPATRKSRRMSDELLSHADGAVHRLTINRPARRNALTPTLARAIATALDEVEDAGPAELVVLRGAGGHFSAGLDLHWLRGLGEAPASPTLQRGLADFQAAVLAVVRCPVPVLAVVEGTAAGFGLDLALACDLRLASHSASFTSAFARMGLVPDGGSTFTLPRLVGIGPALRLLLAGETIDAARALAIGLVDEVVDPAQLDAEVAALAGRLTAGATSQRPGHQAAGAGQESARSSRCSPPRARRRSRRCRARSSAGGWRRSPRVSRRARRGVSRRRPAVFLPDMLAGRVALVTGGGTGIGLGIASVSPRAGAEVAIASRKPEHLEPAAAELRGRGARVSTVETNVREPEAVARMVERVTAEHGRLDILVNNAAGNFYAPSARLSPNAWRAVVETDLYGSFYCAQAVYPVMKAQGGGRIVSISMTLHYRGWPLMAHATAAKAGVDALTRTLAVEWAADRITVNAVAPGPIPTEGVKRASRRRTRARPTSSGWTSTPPRFRSDAGARRRTWDRWSPFSPARPANGSPAPSSSWHGADAVVPRDPLSVVARGAARSGRGASIRESATRGLSKFDIVWWARGACHRYASAIALVAGRTFARPLALPTLYGLRTDLLRGQAQSRQCNCDKTTRRANQSKPVQPIA